MLLPEGILLELGDASVHQFSLEVPSESWALPVTWNAQTSTLSVDFLDATMAVPYTFDETLVVTLPLSFVSVPEPASECILGFGLALACAAARFFEIYPADIHNALASFVDAEGNPILDDLIDWNEVLTASQIPEPSAAMVLLVGGLCVLGTRRPRVLPVTLARPLPREVAERRIEEAWDTASHAVPVNRLRCDGCY